MLSSRPILPFDSVSIIFTVNGSSGKSLSDGVEDVRPAICDDAFSQQVQEVIDSLGLSVDILVDSSDTLPD